MEPHRSRQRMREMADQPTEKEPAAQKPAVDGKTPPSGNGEPGGKGGRKFDRRFILLVLILITAGTLLYNWIKEQQELAAPPSGSGTVEATEIEVGPQVTGRIVQLGVQEGQNVKRGQLIARLDDIELRAQLEQTVGQR